MPKPTKSQWDFGELFPVESSRRILSVSQLTVHIRRLLEQHYSQVWVTGEVTNLRTQTSGHIYFTLKDAGAQLNCVLFRGEAQVDRATLRDGRKVNLRGEVTVYESRGQYQLRVLAVELEGVGALQIAFERLKQKLQAEGLFAQERKRTLPRYPQRIGLVTSPTGAAIRDVLHVIARRNPSLEIILAACRVQGDGAAAEIASAIRLLNEFHRRAQGNSPTFPRVSLSTAKAGLDLILVTRGGGSLEDLWAFNEEAVARAIFDSVLPVVSAVGHEIDFTISDFVADVRAATPSAAAEIITEGIFSSCQFVSEATARLVQLTRQHLEDLRLRSGHTRQRLERLHPRRRVDDYLQHLDELQADLRRCAKQSVRQNQRSWQELSNRLMRARPLQAIQRRRDAVHQTEYSLRARFRHRYGELKNRVEVTARRLTLLGPDQVLARGYSITMDESGAVVRDAHKIKQGQLLKTKLERGLLTSRAEASSSETSESSRKSGAL